MATRSIFVVGDSISIQYGPHLKRMLAASFGYDRKRKAGENVEDPDPYGAANGGDSRQVLGYLQEQKAMDRRHDILLVNCGLHDIRKTGEAERLQVDAAEYETNLRAIAALARDMAKQPLWVTTTPFDEKLHNTRSPGVRRYEADLAAYNRTARKVMAEAGIDVIDLHAFTRSLDPDPYCDHVHFREEVRILQAAFLAGYVYGCCRERTEAAR